MNGTDRLARRSELRPQRCWRSAASREGEKQRRNRFGALLFFCSRCFVCVLIFSGILQGAGLVSPKDKDKERERQEEKTKEAAAGLLPKSTYRFRSAPVLISTSRFV